MIRRLSDIHFKRKFGRTRKDHLEQMIVHDTRDPDKLLSNDTVNRLITLATISNDPTALSVLYEQLHLAVEHIKRNEKPETQADFANTVLITADNKMNKVKREFQTDEYWEKVVTDAVKALAKNIGKGRESLCSPPDVTPMT